MQEKAGEAALSENADGVTGKAQKRAEEKQSSNSQSSPVQGSSSDDESENVDDATE